MYSAPCVRFAIRIRPKISEKPAARRNSNPPSARLLSVWIAQYCRSVLQVVGRRPVPRVDRVLQEILGLVAPELADVRVGVDYLVHQPPELAHHLADVDISNDIAVRVELHRATAGVDLD